MLGWTAIWNWCTIVVKVLEVRVIHHLLLLLAVLNIFYWFFWMVICLGYQINIWCVQVFRDIFILSHDIINIPDLMMVTIVLMDLITIVHKLVKTFISFRVIIHCWIDYVLLLLIINFSTIIIDHYVLIIIHTCCLKLFLLIICIWWNHVLLIRIMSWLIIHEAYRSWFTTISLFLVTNGWLWWSRVDYWLLFKVILKWRILSLNCGSILFR